MTATELRPLSTSLAYTETRCEAAATNYLRDGTVTKGATFLPFVDDPPERHLQMRAGRCGGHTMSASFPLPEWQSGAASSMKAVLIDDEWMDIEDVVTLTGDRLPDWLQRLGIPQNGRAVTLPNNSEVPLAKAAVWGKRNDGGSEAAETICAFGYTGWPLFSDVLEKSAGTLRALGAGNVVTKVLPVSPRRWTAAVRSTGIALIGGRPARAPESHTAWVQQSTYVAGSDQPHAGRLIVQSLFVETASHARLSDDIREASDVVYEGFVAALADT
jgi:hypothetical protein